MAAQNKVPELLTQVPHKVVQSLHKRVVVATFDLCMYNAAQ
jgi:hypothetical protein